MDFLRDHLVCLHNSTRSRIAEGFLNHLAGDRVEAESAGLEPAMLYPPAVEVMREIGIDIASNKSQRVSDVQKRQYQWMITIGDRARTAEGSGFAGDVKYLHWSLPEPLPTSGSPEATLSRIRAIRDQIRAKVEEFLRTCPP